MANIVTNLKENKTLFILCDCNNEILMMEYDHHLQITNLAIYQTNEAFREKMSLWQRVRYCWQVLWYKKPYADKIMLNNHHLLELNKFLASLGLLSK